MDEHLSVWHEIKETVIDTIRHGDLRGHLRALFSVLSGEVMPESRLHIRPTPLETRHVG